MEIKELLELARLGYKPNDIKELLALKTEDPKEDNSNEDLNPDNSDKPDDKDQDKSEDPIEAIIKRNKEEKE